jgi:hypothetical protein
LEYFIELKLTKIQSIMKLQSPRFSSNKGNRVIIGILGIALPFLLVIFQGEILNSISHYYYSRSAFFFHIVLFGFGLFLVSYRGYKKKSKGEFLSDNLITSLAGILALIVVVVPTACEFSGSIDEIKYCENVKLTLLGHPSLSTLSLIHFIAAGLFLFLMGLMALKFTMGNSSFSWLYITSAVIIFSCLALLIISHVFKVNLFDKSTFVLESIAVLFFGISWLVKSKWWESESKIR